MAFHNLPSDIKWKIGHSKIEFNGTKVEAVRVKTEDDGLLEKGISELKSRFSVFLPPIVGIHFMKPDQSTTAYLLVLLVEDLCLFLELNDDGKSCIFSKQLSEFLLDKSICFIGFDVLWYFTKDPHTRSMKFDRRTRYSLTETGSDIRTFAVEVLKKESLANCSDLGELTSHIWHHWGIGEADDLIMVPSDCKARLFSEKQMKKAIHSACYSCYIGNNLLSMIYFPS